MPSNQKDCKYGWVLPDRCRYNPRLGCECGEYPAMVWNGEKYVLPAKPTDKHTNFGIK